MTRFLGLLAAAAFALVAATAAAAPPTAEEALKERVMGSPDAPIEIIEYFSLTCSHCQHFHEVVLPKLKKAYIDTGKVKLILRDFPWDRGALMGAVLARCAPPQRYLSFIDVLFKQQESWAASKDVFQALARIGKLGGVNPADFEACLKDEKLVNGIVDERLAGKKRFDVDGTPTFIIDGDHKIVGSQPFEEFDKILRKKVK